MSKNLKLSWTVYEQGKRSALKINENIMLIASPVYKNKYRATVNFHRSIITIGDYKSRAIAESESIKWYNTNIGSSPEVVMEVKEGV